MLVALLPAASTPVVAGEPRTIGGTATIDVPVRGATQTLVATPPGMAGRVCARAPIARDGAFRLKLPASPRPGCGGKLWFWLRTPRDAPRPFAETATFAGPPHRRLNLHLWAGMGLYGDVITAADTEGASIVACLPQCAARAHAVCGGSAVFDATFAAEIVPRSPDRRCPRAGQRFGLSLRTARGDLYRSTPAIPFSSATPRRADVVVAFPAADTARDWTAGVPKTVARGRTFSFKYFVSLPSTRTAMNFWALVDGPRGTALRSVFATDPLPDSHRLHNTWACNIRSHQVLVDATPGSARCTGFIGPPPPGTYAMFVEVTAPPRAGTIAVRLFNVAYPSHARETVRIRVR